MIPVVDVVLTMRKYWFGGMDIARKKTHLFGYWLDLHALHPSELVGALMCSWDTICCNYNGRIIGDSNFLVPLLFLTLNIAQENGPVDYLYLVARDN
jgi:hypothetical protein